MASAFEDYNYEQTRQAQGLDGIFSPQTAQQQIFPLTNYVSQTPIQQTSQQSLSATGGVTPTSNGLDAYIAKLNEFLPDTTEEIYRNPYGGTQWWGTGDPLAEGWSVRYENPNYSPYWNDNMFGQTQPQYLDTAQIGDPFSGYQQLTPQYYRNNPVEPLTAETFWQKYGTAPEGGWSDATTKTAGWGGFDQTDPLQQWYNNQNYLPTGVNLYGSGSPEDIQRGFNVLQNMSPQNIGEFWYLDPEDQRGMLQNPAIALQQMKAMANPANQDWLSIGAEGGFNNIAAYNWDQNRGLTADPSQYMTVHDEGPLGDFGPLASIIGTGLSFVPGLQPLGIAINVANAAANKNPLGAFGALLPATPLMSSLGGGLGSLFGSTSTALNNALASGLMSGGMTALGGGSGSDALKAALLSGVTSYGGNALNNYFNTSGGAMGEDGFDLTQAITSNYENMPDFGTGFDLNTDNYATFGNYGSDYGVGIAPEYTNFLFQGDSYNPGASLGSLFGDGSGSFGGYPQSFAPQPSYAASSQFSEPTITADTTPSYARTLAQASGELAPDADLTMDLTDSKGQSLAATQGGVEKSVLEKIFEGAMKNPLQVAKLLSTVLGTKEAGQNRQALMDQYNKQQYFQDKLRTSYDQPQQYLQSPEAQAIRSSAAQQLARAAAQSGRRSDVGGQLRDLNTMMMTKALPAYRQGLQQAYQPQVAGQLLSAARGASPTGTAMSGLASMFTPQYSTEQLLSQLMRGQ